MQKAVVLGISTGRRKASRAKWHNERGWMTGWARMLVFLMDDLPSIVISYMLHIKTGCKDAKFWRATFQDHILVTHWLKPIYNVICPSANPHEPLHTYAP